jgi:hypothetical protein
MIEVFLERARQLASARDLLREDAAFSSVTALLSVHTAIALNDALLIRLSGARFRGEDHMSAARETRQQCRSRHLDDSGVKQLHTLLSSKSNVSYGDSEVTLKIALALSVASDRFEVWVYARLKEVA